MTTLLLGDCRDFLPMSVDVVITDPPYGVDKHGRMLGQISANYHEKATHSRGYADHNPEQFRLLLEPAFDGMYQSLPAGANLVTFGGNRTFHEMVTHAEHAGFEMMDVIVFKRRRGSYAKSFTTLVPRHEIAAWMRKRGGTRKINPNKNIPNFFDIPETRVKTGHSTPKSLEVMSKVVEVFSEPGQKVLDPFMGSGGTLVATEALGRVGIGIEKYVTEYNQARERLGLAPIPLDV